MTGPLKHKQEEDYLLPADWAFDKQQHIDVFIHFIYDNCVIYLSVYLSMRWIVRPWRQLSEGQGVVVGQGGRADDDASILGVCLQHLLSLLTSHVEETPAGIKDKEGKKKNTSSLPVKVIKAQICCFRGQGRRHTKHVDRFRRTGRA